MVSEALSHEPVRESFVNTLFHNIKLTQILDQTCPKNETSCHLHCGTIAENIPQWPQIPTFHTTENNARRKIELLFANKWNKRCI